MGRQNEYAGRHGEEETDLPCGILIIFYLVLYMTCRQIMLSRDFWCVVALCLHFALLLVMYFWSLSTQSVYLFFVIAATWGLADGMLITQIVSTYNF